jgi:cytochrome c55X
MRLLGGLGPALTADALRGKNDALLIATVLSGRPGTPMPPWRPYLSETEAAWIVAQLQKGAIRAR